MPEALERAQSILRHIRQLGGRVGDFCVCVTAEEGFELIQWFRSRAGKETDLKLLDADIEVAQSSGDPWVVLQHYELLGLKIERRLH